MGNDWVIYQNDGDSGRFTSKRAFGEKKVGLSRGNSGKECDARTPRRGATILQSMQAEGWARDHTDILIGEACWGGYLQWEVLFRNKEACGAWPNARPWTRRIHGGFWDVFEVLFKMSGGLFYHREYMQVFLISVSSPKTRSSRLKCCSKLRSHYFPTLLFLFLIIISIFIAGRHLFISYFRACSMTKRIVNLSPIFQ